MAKVQTTEVLTKAYKQKKTLEEFRLPDPEFSIPTQDHLTLKLNKNANVQQLNPKVRIENIKQWINQTKPSRIPFEAKSDISTWCGSGVPQTVSEQSIIVTDTIEEEWNRREFDQMYGKIIQRYELQNENEKTEFRKIHEKVKRYKKAFLKGFFEARIRRIESNKWLYDKLHVNPETIKEKYHKLMYNSEICYVLPSENQLFQDQQVSAAEEQNADKSEEKKEDEAKLSENDIESVYSFVPERDNVFLQDFNAPPHIRGFGKERIKKYDTNMKFLHLENWIPSDIQNWLNEKKLVEEDDEFEEGSDINDKYKNVYLENIPGQKPPIKNDEWKYEQIAGVSELPSWLGPKLLDAKPELDLENFRKMSALEDGNEVEEIKEEEKRPQENDNIEEDKASQKSKEDEETNAQKVLKQLTQLPSREYFKLWYNTHDTFNTSPFLESRLQRLLQEVLNKREWCIYSGQLKKRREEHESNKNLNL